MLAWRPGTRHVDLRGTCHLLRCAGLVSIFTHLNETSGPPHLMRAALILIIAAGCAATVSLAQTSQPPAAAEAKLAQNTAPADRRAQPAGKTRTRKKSDNEALASCLAQWDKGTHMSRHEWNRACRRVANRLQNLKVK
jgi:Ni/Co efflux regulator RcnB